MLGLDNIADEEPVKEQLGVVFDSSYLYEQWQVKNVERIVAPLYSSWDSGCYRKYLGTFGLGGAQNGKKHIKDLSRGMQMKLMLAIALSHDAKLLILDEPTNGLDPVGIHEIRTLIRSLPQKYDCTVLVSSHLLPEVELMADDIGILNHGHLLFEGTKEELKTSARAAGFPTDNLEDTFLAMIDEDNRRRGGTV